MTNAIAHALVARQVWVDPAVIVFFVIVAAAHDFTCTSAGVSLNWAGTM